MCLLREFLATSVKRNVRCDQGHHECHAPATKRGRSIKIRIRCEIMTLQQKYRYFTAPLSDK